MLGFLKSVKANILGSAVLCVLLGILLAVYPNTSLTVVCRMVGVMVLIPGLGMILGYLRKKQRGFLAKAALVFGSILVIVGGFIILYPLGILSIVPIMFGVLLIYHGIANVKEAVELRQYKDKGWWIPVLIAASTILLGFMIMNNPFDTMETLMRLIGACLIYDGLANTMLVGRFIKSIRNFRKLEKAEAAECEETLLEDSGEIIDGELKEI